MEQSVVEYLADRYNYLIWMRNRDEISAGTADEWRAKFLKEALELEKQQIIKAYQQGVTDEYGDTLDFTNDTDAEQYYNNIYKIN